ncbi:glycosyl hydrolase family 65 protein [Klugiella xanthotipulae]|uniref:Alpha,alpha-trehalose phosphorylase n=1 Tax=Klugiella xanthotipulae TaxID=244735 RepID=A0A543HT31_9MICO|nr:glycosyl hydrolase family 65 protein [Klugiella xanthotipulae]TQM61513.1 alpha,alpha-trehalose phosphorylase [Klugiella xanthotipulae]
MSGPQNSSLSPDDFLDRGRYPVDEWKLSEKIFDDGDFGRTETIFAVGNGYLGMRGNYEEGRDSHSHGTFINGLHETWTIQHAEQAYGFAQVGQTIINAPDAKVIRLYVDDEPLNLRDADMLHYDRTLDFADGVLTRSLIWQTPSGKKVLVRSSRMVSFAERHLALLTFEVTMLEGEAPVAISCQILNRQDGHDEYGPNSRGTNAGADPRQADEFATRVLQPQTFWQEGKRSVLSYKLSNSGMTVACAADHYIDTGNEYEEKSMIDGDTAKHVYRVQAKEGQSITVTKVVSYHSSSGVPAKELVDRCRRTLDRVEAEGISHQFAEQREWLNDYWTRSDVEVPGHPAVQQAVRWNLFHLAQASARAEGSGIPAKGLTGSGYSGHYFWDTEIYVLPFLTYTTPRFARNALRFRYNMLPAARLRAIDLNERGALFPWRTINGEEASAYYAAGTAQYHIDADITYAVAKYVAATGDEDFLAREAVDIVVETARMWADLGFWRRSGDHSFHIHGVTGPDEYTTVVNDNLFTNVMARFNLEYAVSTVGRLAAARPDEHERMVARLGLSMDEVTEWGRAAAAMFIPLDEHLGMHPQDAHFLEREMWDLENTPDEKRPLLLHFHPLVIYRFQVLKQADVVLALFLHGEEFTPEQKLADFEYYDPITTGDSTLSAVVQSIIAAEVGYHELALSYFDNALFVDLADLHQNTADGVHVASTGGVWNAIVSGFGGMRDNRGVVSFDPRLPQEWEELTYRLTIHDTRVRVTLRQDSLAFTVEEGSSVTVTVRGETHTIVSGEPRMIPLDGHGPRRSGAPSQQDIEDRRRADGTLITATLPIIR